MISARRELGWSGQKLAEEAGLSYSTVRDMEAGYSRGRRPTKAAIARALGKSIEELEVDTERHTLVTAFTKEQLETIYITLKSAIRDEWTAIANEEERKFVECEKQVAILRNENLRLNARLSQLPDDFLEHWSKIPDVLKVICVSFVTGDFSHLQALEGRDRDQAMQVFFALGLNKLLKD